MLEKSGEKGILVIDNIVFDLMKEYLDILDKLADKLPFIKVLNFSLQYHKVKSNNRKEFRITGLKKIKGLFDKYHVDTVITSNDIYFFAQYALSINKQGTNIFLEEGAGNYNNINRKREKGSIHNKFIKSPFQSWLYPKVYFKDWQRSPKHGANQYLNKFYFSHPEYVTIIDCNKSNCLPLENNFFLYQNLFTDHLLDYFKLSDGFLAEIDIIILLAHSDRHGEEYISAILNICNKNPNKRVVFKKHPTDFYNYKEIEKLSNTSFLPNIAFEFLMPYLLNTTILGDAATSLMLAKKSDMDVFMIKASKNFYSEKNNWNKRLRFTQKLFEKMGIDYY
jgi:hypothetical protein